MSQNLQYNVNGIPANSQQSQFGGQQTQSLFQGQFVKLNLDNYVVNKDVMSNKLIQEREELRQAYADLQSEYQRDLQLIKDHILREASNALESELDKRSLEFMNETNLLRAQMNSIQSQLYEKDIRLVNTSEQLNKLKIQNSELESELKQQKEKKNKLKEKLRESLEQMRFEHENELKIQTKNVENEIYSKAKIERMALEHENQQLLMKLKEQDSKLKLMGEMAADIEKFRQLVQMKNKDILVIQAEADSTKNNYEKQIRYLTSQLKREQDLQNEIERLNQKIKKMELVPERIIEKEFITVDRPVEVEKIIEIIKEVPVETVIREKVAPKQAIVVQELMVPSDDALKDKLNRKKEKIKEQKEYIETIEIKIQEMDGVIAQLQEDIQQYSDNQIIFQQEARKYREQIQIMQETIRKYVERLNSLENSNHQIQYQQPSLRVLNENITARIVQKGNN